MHEQVVGSSARIRRKQNLCGYDSDCCHNLLLSTALEASEVEEFGRAVEHACVHEAPSGWRTVRDLCESGLDAVLNIQLCMKIFASFRCHVSSVTDFDADLIRVVEICTKRFSGQIRVDLSDDILSMIEPLFQHATRLSVMSALLDIGYYLTPTASAQKQRDYLRFIVNLSSRIGLYEGFPDAAYMLCFEQLLKCCPVTECESVELCDMMCQLMVRQDWSFQTHALSCLLVLLDKYPMLRDNQNLIHTMVVLHHSISSESVIVWMKIVRVLDHVIIDEPSCRAFLESGALSSVMKTTPNREFPQLQSRVFGLLSRCIDISPLCLDVIEISWLRSVRIEDLDFQSKMSFAQLMASIIMRNDMKLIEELLKQFGEALAAVLDSDDHKVTLHFIRACIPLAERSAHLFQGNIAAIDELRNSSNVELAQSADVLLKAIE